MWEYFSTDPYNWSLFVEMAEHAGLKDVFEGTSSYGKDITFLGITNHSIRRYLLTNGYEKVTDMDKEVCKKMILTSILNKRIMLDDFIPGTPSSDPMEIIGEGGKMYETLSGDKLWIYTFREAYNEVPKKGSVRIYIVSPNIGISHSVASSNIITQTGIVHSLSYNFTLGDF
ncbi:MAG: hypothetical protein KGV44_02435 [Flavobacteriaceae bacterium]|nr:hypothetical protein [Flavobacteriaceae bacterium]